MSWLTENVILLVVLTGVSGGLAATFGILAGFAAHQEAVVANEAAAKANERAAELDKTAAQLRLDLERERSRAAARPWTSEQFDALQDVKGLVKNVGILWEAHCIECSLFAWNIEYALHSAGVQIYGAREFEFTMASSTGILVWLPVGSDLETDPLVVALKKAKLNPSTQFHNEFSKIRTDIPVIFVGERFPSFLTLPYNPPPSAGNVTILPIEKQ